MSSIHHSTADQEFTTTRDGYEAELAYARPTQDLIDFTHTYVDENLRGQGVAEELARAALAYAREQHLRVQTSCKFMAGFVQRHHDEYADLLAQQ
jgi:predicted GNAT family acetyltransferase